MQQRPFCPKLDPLNPLCAPLCSPGGSLMLRKQVACCLNPERPDCPVGSLVHGISPSSAPRAQTLLFVNVQRENAAFTPSLQLQERLPEVDSLLQTQLMLAVFFAASR